MKQLEENIKKNFCYFGLGTVCLDMAPKLQSTKEKKMVKQHFNKL